MRHSEILTRQEGRISHYVRNDGVQSNNRVEPDRQAFESVQNTLAIRRVSRYNRAGISLPEFSL